MKVALPPIDRMLNDGIDFIEPLLDLPWQEIHEHFMGELGFRNSIARGLYAHML